MILDTLEGLRDTLPGPVWEAATKFAQEAAGLPPGRYQLKNGIYAMVQEGTTAPVTEGLFEAHQKYADLQILAEGQELLVWAPLPALEEKIPYDAGRDAGFYGGEGTEINVRPGMCYVMYPHDAHKACCHRGTPAAYRKLVIKIPL